MICWVAAALAFGPSPSERTEPKHITLNGTTWSYQAAQNIVDFAGMKDQPIGNALLGWGDIVLMGPNEGFKGTLGKTPPGNGIGATLNLSGSLVNGILEMRAVGSVACGGVAHKWIYDYYGNLMPVWVDPESPPKYFKRTIVGSVVREKDHPGTKEPCENSKNHPWHAKGQTGSFWMVLGP
mmetsp:Transcript_18179/g.41681  ORF Transcript_18179/g.41681 Transcript_18179/m.41681 type:complete len:181 (-) Transcript_18179:432-974(-)